MIPEQRLAEIRARLEAATPGSWSPYADDRGWCVLLDHENVGVIAEVLDARTAEGDARLIAHAPADLAYLLARVQRLERVAAETHDYLIRVSTSHDPDGEAETLRCQIARALADLEADDE